MIKSAPYYWVICDECGVNAQGNSDYSAWKEPAGAWAEAEGSDWSEKAGKHYCDDCTSTLPDEEDEPAEPQP